MLLNSLKYLALLIALLALYIILPIGDYESGLTHLFGFIAIGTLFLIFSFTVIITKVVQGNKKFDYSMTLITVAFLVITYSTFAHDKFWTKPILETQVNDPNVDGFSLILYKNKSFGLRESHLEFIKVYQGDYTISKDTLRLLREDLPKLTNELIPNRYLIKRYSSQTDRY